MKTWPSGAASCRAGQPRRHQPVVVANLAQVAIDEIPTVVDRADDAPGRAGQLAAAPGALGASRPGAADRLDGEDLIASQQQSKAGSAFSASDHRFCPLSICADHVARGWRRRSSCRPGAPHEDALAGLPARQGGKRHAVDQPIEVDALARVDDEIGDGSAIASTRPMAVAAMRIRSGSASPWASMST